MFRAELQRTGRALAHHASADLCGRLIGRIRGAGCPFHLFVGAVGTAPASARLAAKISDRYEGDQINSWVKSG